MALRVSNVIFKRTAIKLVNTSFRPDDTMRAPVMQLYVWAKGTELGIILYDTELSQLHMLQRSPEQQKALGEILLNSSGVEIAQTLLLMLETEVEYSEVYDQTLEKFVGTVKFHEDEVLPVYEPEPELEPEPETTEIAFTVNMDDLEGLPGIDDFSDTDEDEEVNAVGSAQEEQLSFGTDGTTNRPNDVNTS